MVQLSAVLTPENTQADFAQFTLRARVDEQQKDLTTA